MTRQRNLRLTMASIFFGLCLVASFALVPQPADAGGNCWQCGGIDWCKSTNFGWEECDAVALESCTVSGNFCN
ncbi:MAG: hypothetical protein AAGD38_14260 [Acidobacteriota bacterium]